MAQVRNYTGLLSGTSLTGKTGTGAFATFSFVTAPQPYLEGSYYSPAALATFRAFSETEKAAVRQAFAAFSAVSGLTFFEVAPEDGDFKFGAYDMDVMRPGAGGFAYYPDNGFGWDLSSDVFIDDALAANPHILLHEIGHALGLKHSFEGTDILAPDLDNYANTVMSYTSGGSPGNVLGPLDIDALRYLYGDTDAKGRQIASWSWDQATLTLTQTGSELADDINGIGGSDIIYGMGGNDRIRTRGGGSRVFGGDGDDEITGGNGANYFDGGNGNDTLRGGAGNDELIGGAGNDNLNGNGGNDRITAGDGDDQIYLYGTYGAFSIDGGAGRDMVQFTPTLAPGATFSIPALLAGGSILTGVEAITISVMTAATVVGSDLRDNIFLSDGADDASGMAGDDYIAAGKGDDRIRGGDGNDTIDGGLGDDTLWGDAGNDNLQGSGGFDRIDGGTGNDTISLSGTITGFVVDGGADTDTLYLMPTLAPGATFSIPAMLAGGSSLTGVEAVSITISTAATVVGSDLRDSMTLSAGADEAFGQAGDDSITGGLGDDQLHGGDGIDYLYGGLGNDLLWGDAGNDQLDGGGGRDALYGGAGDDTLRLTLSAALTGYVLDGGDGNDNAIVSVVTPETTARVLTDATLGLAGVERLTLTAGGGNDTIEIRGVASIVIDAGAGDDTIVAGPAGGSIYGGLGTDFITAGNGTDYLNGGGGADRFIFPGGAASTSRAQDQIADFQTGVDLIDLTALAPTNVRIQSSGSDRWVYADSASGSFQLYLRGTVAMSDIVTTGLTLAGTSGADRLVGTAGADRLSGGGGNDMLVGGAGDDVLDGGADVDSASYVGLYRSYGATTAAGVVTLRGGAAEGTDTLTSVERVAFRDGMLVSDPDSVGAQVMRLYDTVLDRGPDGVGLDFWVDQIQGRGATLATVANSFVVSAEFQAVTGGVSNAAFVDYVYSQALGRGADEGGKAYWTGRLDAGLSRGELLIGFSESAEHRAATAGMVAQGYFDTDDAYQAVALLYDSFVGRRPDTDGLVFWSEQVKSGSRTLAQVAGEFAASAEFAGATRGMSNTQLVDFMYQNTLDRAADGGGRAFWAGQLDNGLSRGDLLLAFSQSGEHASLLARYIIGGIDAL